MDAIRRPATATDAQQPANHAKFAMLSASRPATSQISNYMDLRNVDLPTLINSFLLKARFFMPGTDMNLSLQEYRCQYRVSQTPIGINGGFPSFFFVHALIDLPETEVPLFGNLVEFVRRMVQSHIDPKTSRISFSTNLPVAWSYPEPEIEFLCGQAPRCAALTGPRRAWSIASIRNHAALWS